MKSSPFLPSLALALLLTPVLASAQPEGAPQNRPGMRREGGGGPGQGPGQREDRNRARMGGRGSRQERQPVMMMLNLTEVQQAELRKVRETATRDRLRKSTDLRIARMDLRSLMGAEKVDEKAVGAKLAEVQAAQGALLKLRVDTALARKRILTPEQQKKMNGMPGNRGGGREKRIRSIRSRGMGRNQPAPDRFPRDKDEVREEV